MRELIVHGHFYQPPREDPWTGRVPTEPGAGPDGNWNARIHRECYRPNARAGNFEVMSFNVGPTLLRWLEGHDPGTVRQLAEADAANVRRYGAGNAMAQVYNHVIMPLATPREQRLQVVWGAREFRRIFGRAPRGMWLAECAVDAPTLEVLVDEGIEFTILAPWQVRGDQREPGWARLPSGRRIVIFPYDSLSGSISFDDSATVNADTFVSDWLGASGYAGPGLRTLATDGELYGHHKPLRDHFLAYLLRNAAPRGGYRVTWPERYLAEHEITHEFELVQPSSWSCHHGVKRWGDGCDCTWGWAGWKWPLRQALRNLATALDAEYERLAWRLRISNLWAWVEERGLNPEAETEPRRRRLLESHLRRHLMFTSCAWFFEDLDRLEPQYALASAAVAIDALRRAGGGDVEPDFLDALQSVWSCRGVNAAELYQRLRRRAAKAA